MSNTPGQALTVAQPEDDSPNLAEGGAYQLPPEAVHPSVIAGRLLQLPEFSDLVEGEAKIDWLLKRDQKTRGGRHILGTAHMPKVQGDLNPCFQWMLANLFKRDPDFLIILDRAYWFAATPILREILVYHELTHCIHKTDNYGDKRYDMDERPVWGLRGHDVEEFTAVVRRYGAWNHDIKSFCAAIIAHTEETQVSGIVTQSG